MPPTVASSSQQAPRLESHVSPDVFLHVPTSVARLKTGGAARKIRHETTDSGTTATATSMSLNLVFFITGNPGLIGYYHPFLAGLARALDGKDKDDEQRERSRGGGAVPVLAGFSLGGFEVEDWDRDCDSRAVTAEGQSASGRHESLRDLLFPASAALSPSSCREKIHTLAEQVALCYARLENLVGRIRLHFAEELAGSRRKGAGGGGGGGDAPGASGMDAPDVEIDVTLIGHSVGAYIALELVRLCHERARNERPSLSLSPSQLSPGSASSAPATAASTSTTTDTTTTAAAPAPSPARWHIDSSILLTPTIQDLYLSPSGRMASLLLTYTPFMPGLAHGLVQNVLVNWLPGSWIEALVQRATGMRVGSHGLATTLAFLRSRNGVRQALEMAKCELREIRGESWGGEVWGATAVAEVDGHGDGVGQVVRTPRLYFWFAKQDHWVADVTREEILRRRGGRRTGFLYGDGQGKLGPGDGLQSEEYHRVRNRAPKILIDETERLVHAWCLTQSELVTRRVGGWLEELWDQNE